MTSSETDAWQEATSGRERVRQVVETADAPATVTEIADRAAVAWSTANDELERLTAENQVRERDIDGSTKYEPNPVQQFLDQILEYIREYERDELEDRLIEHQSELESLRDEYDVDSVADLRERIADEKRSADEMRQIRNVAETMEALQMERRLYRHALNLYDDVDRFSEAGENAGTVSA